MSDYSLHIPASTTRRFGALLVNIVPFALSGWVFTIPAIARFHHLRPILEIIGIVALSVLMDSPGKRVFKLKVYYDDQQPIGAKGRLFRNASILLYEIAAAVASFSHSENQELMMVIGVLMFAIVVFLFADNFSVLFTPENRSLMDLRFRTRVYAPRPPLRPETQVFGITIR